MFLHTPHWGAFAVLIPDTRPMGRFLDVGRYELGVTQEYGVGDVAAYFRRARNPIMRTMLIHLRNIQHKNKLAVALISQSLMEHRII